MNAEEKIKVLKKMRFRMFESCIDRNDQGRVFFYFSGLCNAFANTTGISLHRMVIEIPEIEIQKKEKPYDWSSFWWTFDSYGFLCRMRAIRKAKNAIKKQTEI